MEGDPRKQMPYGQDTGRIERVVAATITTVFALIIACKLIILGNEDIALAALEPPLDRRKRRGISTQTSIGAEVNYSSSEDSEYDENMTKTPGGSTRQLVREFSLDDLDDLEGANDANVLSASNEQVNLSNLNVEEIRPVDIECDLRQEQTDSETVKADFDSTNQHKIFSQAPELTTDKTSDIDSSVEISESVSDVIKYSVSGNRVMYDVASISSEDDFEFLETIEEETESKSDARTSSASSPSSSDSEFESSNYDDTPEHIDQQSAPATSSSGSKWLHDSEFCDEAVFPSKNNRGSYDVNVQNIKDISHEICIQDTNIVEVSHVKTCDVTDVKTTDKSNMATDNNVLSPDSGMEDLVSPDKDLRDTDSTSPESAITVTPVMEEKPISDAISQYADSEPSVIKEHNPKSFTYEYKKTLLMPDEKEIIDIPWAESSLPSKLSVVQELSDSALIASDSSTDESESDSDDSTDSSSGESSEHESVKEVPSDVGGTTTDGTTDGDITNTDGDSEGEYEPNAHIPIAMIKTPIIRSHDVSILSTTIEEESEDLSSTDSDDASHPVERVKPPSLTSPKREKVARIYDYPEDGEADSEGPNKTPPNEKSAQKLSQQQSQQLLKSQMERELIQKVAKIEGKAYENALKLSKPIGEVAVKDVRPTGDSSSKSYQAKQTDQAHGYIMPTHASAEEKVVKPTFLALLKAEDVHKNRHRDGTALSLQTSDNVKHVKKDDAYIDPTKKRILDARKRFFEEGGLQVSNDSILKSISEFDRHLAKLKEKQKSKAVPVPKFEDIEEYRKRIKARAASTPEDGRIASLSAQYMDERKPLSYSQSDMHVEDIVSKPLRAKSSSDIRILGSQTRLVPVRGSDQPIYAQPIQANYTETDIDSMISKHKNVLKETNIDDVFEKSNTSEIFPEIKHQFRTVSSVPSSPLLLSAAQAKSRARSTGDLFGNKDEVTPPENQLQKEAAEGSRGTANWKLYEQKAHTLPKVPKSILKNKPPPNIESFDEATPVQNSTYDSDSHVPSSVSVIKQVQLPGHVKGSDRQTIEKVKVTGYDLPRKENDSDEQKTMKSLDLMEKAPVTTTLREEESDTTTSESFTKEEFYSSDLRTQDGMSRASVCKTSRSLLEKESTSMIRTFKQTITAGPVQLMDISKLPDYERTTEVTHGKTEENDVNLHQDLSVLVNDRSLLSENRQVPKAQHTKLEESDILVQDQSKIEDQPETSVSNQINIVSNEVVLQRVVPVTADSSNLHADAREIPFEQAHPVSAADAKATAETSYKIKEVNDVAFQKDDTTPVPMPQTQAAFSRTKEELGINQLTKSSVPVPKPRLSIRSQITADDTILETRELGLVIYRPPEETSLYVEETLPSPKPDAKTIDLMSESPEIHEKIVSSNDVLENKNSQESVKNPDLVSKPVAPPKPKNLKLPFFSKVKPGRINIKGTEPERTVVPNREHRIALSTEQHSNEIFSHMDARSDASADVTISELPTLIKKEAKVQSEEQTFTNILPGTDSHEWQSKSHVPSKHTNEIPTEAKPAEEQQKSVSPVKLEDIEKDSNLTISLSKQKNSEVSSDVSLVLSDVIPHDSAAEIQANVMDRKSDIFHPLKPFNRLHMSEEKPIGERQFVKSNESEPTKGKPYQIKTASAKDGVPIKHRNYGTVVLTHLFDENDEQFLIAKDYTPVSKKSKAKSKHTHKKSPKDVAQEISGRKIINVAVDNKENLKRERLQQSNHLEYQPDYKPWKDELHDKFNDAEMYKPKLIPRSPSSIPHGHAVYEKGTSLLGKQQIGEPVYVNLAEVSKEKQRLASLGSDTSANHSHKDIIEPINSHCSTEHRPDSPASTQVYDKVTDTIFTVTLDSQGRTIERRPATAKELQSAVSPLGPSLDFKSDAQTFPLQKVGILETDIDMLNEKSNLEKEHDMDIPLYTSVDKYALPMQKETGKTGEDLLENSNAPITMRDSDLKDTKPSGNDVQELAVNKFGLFIDKNRSPNASKLYTLIDNKGRPMYVDSMHRPLHVSIDGKPFYPLNSKVQPVYTVTGSDGIPLYCDAKGLPLYTDDEGSALLSITDSVGKPIYKAADDQPLLPDEDGAPLYTIDGSELRPLDTDESGQPLCTVIDNHGNLLYVDQQGRPICTDCRGALKSSFGRICMLYTVANENGCPIYTDAEKRPLYMFESGHPLYLNCSATIQPVFNDSQGILFTVVDANGEALYTDGKGNHLPTDMLGNPQFRNGYIHPLCCDQHGNVVYLTEDGDPLYTITFPNGTPVYKDINGCPLLTSSKGKPVNPILSINGKPLFKDDNGKQLFLDSNESPIYLNKNSEVRPLYTNSSGTPLARSVHTVYTVLDNDEFPLYMEFSGRPVYTDSQGLLLRSDKTTDIRPLGKRDAKGRELYEITDKVGKPQYVDSKRHPLYTDKHGTPVYLKKDQEGNLLCTDIDICQMYTLVDKNNCPVYLDSKLRPLATDAEGQAMNSLSDAHGRLLYTDVRGQSLNIDAEGYPTYTAKDATVQPLCVDSEMNHVFMDHKGNKLYTVTDNEGKPLFKNSEGQSLLTDSTGRPQQMLVDLTGKPRFTDEHGMPVYTDLADKLLFVSKDAEVRPLYSSVEGVPIFSEISPVYTVLDSDSLPMYSDFAGRPMYTDENGLLLHSAKDIRPTKKANARGRQLFEVVDKAGRTLYIDNKRRPLYTNSQGIPLYAETDDGGHPLYSDIEVGVVCTLCTENGCPIYTEKHGLPLCTNEQGHVLNSLTDKNGKPLYVDILGKPLKTDSAGYPLFTFGDAIVLPLSVDTTGEHFYVDPLGRPIFTVTDENGVPLFKNHEQVPLLTEKSGRPLSPALTPEHQPLYFDEKNHPLLIDAEDYPVYKTKGAEIRPLHSKTKGHSLAVQPNPVYTPTSPDGRVLYTDYMGRPMYTDVNGRLLPVTEEFVVTTYGRGPLGEQLHTITDPLGVPLYIDAKQRPLYTNASGIPLYIEGGAGNVNICPLFTILDEDGRPVYTDMNKNPLCTNSKQFPLASLVDSKKQPLYFSDNDQPLKVDTKGLPVYTKLGPVRQLFVDDNGKPLYRNTLNDVLYTITDKNGKCLYKNSDASPLLTNVQGRPLNALTDSAGSPLYKDKAGVPLLQDGHGNPLYKVKNAEVRPLHSIEPGQKILVDPRGRAMYEDCEGNPVYSFFVDQYGSPDVKSNTSEVIPLYRVTAATQRDKPLKQFMKVKRDERPGSTQDVTTKPKMGKSELQKYKNLQIPDYKASDYMTNGIPTKIARSQSPELTRPVKTEYDVKASLFDDTPEDKNVLSKSLPALITPTVEKNIIVRDTSALLKKNHGTIVIELKMISNERRPKPSRSKSAGDLLCAVQSSSRTKSAPEYSFLKQHPRTPKTPGQDEVFLLDADGSLPQYASTPKTLQVLTHDISIDELDVEEYDPVNDPSNEELMKMSFEEAVDQMLDLAPSRPESPVEEFIAEKVDREIPKIRPQYKSLSCLDAEDLNESIHHKTPMKLLKSTSAGHLSPSISSIEDIANLEYASEEAWKKATADPKNIEKYIQRDEVLLRCFNPRCSTVVNYEDIEAKSKCKSCWNCYTYYCSAECRREHWNSHKTKCTFARVNTLCKKVCVKIVQDYTIVRKLSKVAVHGWKKKGRGCVVLNLGSADTGQVFLLSGFRDIKSNAYFLPIEKLEKENSGLHLTALRLMCKQYNPEERFVCNVTIIPGEGRPEKLTAKYQGACVKKCVKVWLDLSK